MINFRYWSEINTKPKQAKPKPITFKSTHMFGVNYAILDDFGLILSSVSSYQIRFSKIKHLFVRVLQQSCYFRYSKGMKC